MRSVRWMTWTCTGSRCVSSASAVRVTSESRARCRWRRERDDRAPACAQFCRGVSGFLHNGGQQRCGLAARFVVYLFTMCIDTQIHTHKVDTRTYSVQALTHADVDVNTQQCWGRQDRW